MISAEYQRIKYISFRRYFEKIIKDQFDSKESEEKKDKAIDFMIEHGGELTGFVFYKILTSLNADLDKACEELFSDFLLNELFQLKPDSSKLAIFISGITLTEENLAKSIRASKTHFSNAKNNKEDLFAFEVFALAKLCKIKPSQLFNYLYGDGERPIVGLVPDAEEKGKSEEEKK